MKKRFSIIVLLLAMTVIALDFYVQSDAFSARLRPYILAPLQEMLGPGARIGLIKANAVPLYLEVRDVLIPGDTVTDSMQIRKVRVYINPFALFVGRISLPTITLLEPRISLTRSTNGELSLQQVTDRIKNAATKGQNPRYTIHLGTITIQNGTLVFQDRATETAVTMTSLAMNAQFKSSFNSVRLSVRGATVRIETKMRPELTFSLRGGAEYEHEKLSLTKIELQSPDVNVAVSGFWEARPDGNLDLTLSSRFGQQTLSRFTALMGKNVAKGRRPHVDVVASIKGKMPEPDVDGTITLSEVPLQSFTVQDAGLAFSYRNSVLSLTGKQWRIAKAPNTITVDSVAALIERQPSSFTIRKLEINAGDLIARGTGVIDMKSGYSVDLTMESSGKSRTLSFLTGVSLEGKASLQGRLTGELLSPAFEGELAAGPVTIKDILFHDAAGSVQFRNNIASFSHMDIHQLGSRYILDGSIDLNHENIYYSAHLNVVRSDVVSIVALFYEPLPLQLSAAGEITFAGSSSDFSGSAVLTLGPGSAYGESFSKGSLSVTLTPERVSFPQLVLQKGKGTVEGNGWIDYKNGTYASQLTSRGVNLAEVDHLAGMLLSGLFDLDITSRGRFADPQVKAVLTLAEFRYRDLSLGGSNAKLAISSGMLTLGAAFLDDKVRLTGTLDVHTPYAWNASADLRSADIAPFIASGSGDMLSRIKIVAEGTATAHGRGTAVPFLAGSAVFPHIGLTVGDYRIENDGNALVNIEGGKLMIKALNFTGPGTRMAVTGSSRIMKDYDLTFSGKANLSLLRLLYREIEHSDGNAIVQLTVGDTWEKPEIAGDLRIEKGELKIKDIPQTFNGLNGAIAFNPERIVIESLTGDIGGGKMKLSGWVQLARFIPGAFSTRVAFDNVAVRYPPGLASTLSGDLYYEGDASEQDLSGDVLIKRALYDRRVEWKSMLLDTFKGFSQKRKTEIGWIGETQLNIRFHGKDNILIQNNLAKIPLEVDTFIRGTPSQPQLLGRLEARSGVAYFRRNDFKIQHASVDFVDPNRINPVLDVQAETRVREYTIRLAISGAADRATVTFVSDPPLSEIDVLSMLALGKTSADLKGKGTEVGMSEAASFATGQFQDLFERRARSLTGFDRFQVDPYLSKDTSVPRVTVGKELIQDKLYFTYSSNVGTTTPDTVLRIEYVLDRHFSLVGEQNELGTIGGDVKFRFEFK